MVINALLHIRKNNLEKGSGKWSVAEDPHWDVTEDYPEKGQYCFSFRYRKRGFQSKCNSRISFLVTSWLFKGQFECENVEAVDWKDKIEKTRQWVVESRT